MGFNGVNDEELDPVAIFSLQCFSGSDLLPKWWSGKGSENHHHRLFLLKPGKPKLGPMNIPQREVDRRFSNPQADLVKIALAGCLDSSAAFLQSG